MNILRAILTPDRYKLLSLTVANVVLKSVIFYHTYFINRRLRTVLKILQDSRQ
jgi:hypothetical protein